MSKEEIIEEIEKNLKRRKVIPRKRDRRVGEEKPVENNEEEYPDDEYIDNENDPQAVEKITEEDYTTIYDDEKIEFDEIFEIVRAKITNLTNYDQMMEKKVLDSLRRDKLK